MTNIKAFVVAAAITAGAAVPLYYADAAGRTERVTADLEKRTATVAWTWTDMTDHAVRLSLTRNGEDFPTAGWGGSLFIGDGALGCAVAGDAHGYNELLFDVGREYVPTNGKYAVQIIATNAAGRVEEWARGTLTVRANPAADGMPTNWNTYANIARRVAPFIDATGILSDPANAEALWGAVSNRTDDLIQAVSPTPDFTTGNETLVATIAATAPAPGDYATVSNRAMSALQSHQSLRPSTNYTDEALSAFAATGAVARATAYGTATRWTDASGDVWEELDVWSGDNVSLIRYEANQWRSKDDDSWMSFNNGTWTAGIDARADIFSCTGHEDDTSLTMQGDYGTITLTRGIATNLVGRVAMTNDIPATVEEEDPTVPDWAKAENKPQYSAGEVGAYPSADGNALAATVNSWESYWGGTNVIFEVTNYYGNTSGEMPRLRIKEFKGGAWTNVWDEADKFDVCKADILRDVAASNAAVLAEAGNSFAPKAWGTYSDKGTTNVLPNTTFMANPETYFGGGTEYQRVAVGSGAVCVLVDKGALAKTAVEPGTFRFQDDGGTNYFGFSKSDSYTVGCNTDGITVEGSLVTLRYDVIMGGAEVPIVYWRLALDSGTWAQLNNSDGTAADGAPYTVTWYTSGGSYYAAINCGSNASGFFKAETSVMGDVVFETNMKVRLGSGIVCTNTASGTVGVIRPTYNGSTVTWTWSAR